MLQSGLSDALQHRPLVAVPLLFLAGLVTSLNPCIYPMIPITAGALAGVNAPGRTRRRTLGLTLTYVGGLALFYALLGMIAGMTGSLFGTIGASFWARLIIGNLLLVFALAMLEVIPVRLPAGLSAWTASLGGGSYPAVFLLGATSGLVAAPWLPAPAVIGIPVGETPPAVTLESLTGDSVALSQWIGKKPVIVEFWATWCPICAELLPRMEAAQKKFGDHAEFLVVAVAVN